MSDFVKKAEDYTGLRNAIEENIETLQDNFDELSHDNALELFESMQRFAGWIYKDSEKIIELIKAHDKGKKE